MGASGKTSFRRWYLSWSWSIGIDRWKQKNKNTFQVDKCRGRRRTPSRYPQGAVRSHLSTCGVMTGRRWGVLGQGSAHGQGASVGAVGECVEEVPVQELECCWWAIVRARAKAAVGRKAELLSLVISVHWWFHCMRLNKDEQVWSSGWDGHADFSFVNPDSLTWKLDAFSCSLRDWSWETLPPHCFTTSFCEFSYPLILQLGNKLLVKVKVQVVRLCLTLCHLLELSRPEYRSG